MALLRARFPDREVREVRPIGADESGGATGKALGYGVPLRIVLADRAGRLETVVLHFARPDEFGHDRRADRAAELLLAFDTFGGLPRHARALDVGAVRGDGSLVSLGDAGEFWLLTSFAPGRPYAEDLRRVAATGEAAPLDLARAEALARHLVELHGTRLDAPPAWVRALRDLVGHGEGIFGIVDGYPDGTPGAPPERLEALERACVAYRWRLKRRAHRLVRTHGDFHPFNVVFGEGAELTCLDASRGCAGDAADDVTCMAINFPFFAQGARGAGLRALWRRFWQVYRDGRPDDGLLEAAPPFWAWRALVVCNPKWYPALPAEARDRLLGSAERALAAGGLDLAAAEALFP